MKTCLRCIIKGRVQGVFFRAATAEQATRLGIQGWAKNLGDGSVEVLACGEQQAVKQLQTWLHQGPPMAQVKSVNCNLTDLSQCPTDFSTH